MKKLKYILASVVLATAFTSCETEAIDEKLKDETVAGKPILRFELNDKQTIVTDKVEVKWTGANSFSMKARFSAVNNQKEDPDSPPYDAANLIINYSHLTMASFPTVLSVDNPSNYTSSAILEIYNEKDKRWDVFTTSNAKENQQAGFSNITDINEESKNFEGNFEYILFFGNETKQPQRVSGGQFKYVKY